MVTLLSFRMLDDERLASRIMPSRSIMAAVTFIIIFALQGEGY